MINPERRLPRGLCDQFGEPAPDPSQLRPVDGYLGAYTVSSSGDVYSMPRTRQVPSRYDSGPFTRPFGGVKLQPNRGRVGLWHPTTHQRRCVSVRVLLAETWPDR